MLIPKSVLDLHTICDGDAQRYALSAVRLERGDWPTGEQPAEPVAVASDGRRLLALGWPEPDAADYPANSGFSPAALPNYVAHVPKAACQAAGRRLGQLSRSLLRVKPILAHVAIEERPADDEKPSPVPLVTTDIETVSRQEVPQTEGRYPDWRGCIPRYVESDSVSVTVDAKLLEGLLTVLSKHCADGAPSGGAAVTITLGLDSAAYDTPDGKELRPLAARGYSRPVVLSAKTAEGNSAIGVVMPICPPKDPAEPLLPVWSPPAKPA